MDCIRTLFCSLALILLACASDARAGVISTFAGSTLTITTTAGDSVAITTGGGNALINGASSVPPAPVSQVHTIEITGDALDNLIDLTQMEEDFGSLTVRVSGLGGVDVIHGSLYHDEITGGTGSDTIEGNGGDDLIIWNNGDGSDIVTGGSGFDTQQVNGSSTGADVFSLANDAAPNVRFERTSLGVFAISGNGLERFDIRGLGGADSLAVGDLTGSGIIDVVYTGGPDGDTLIGTATAAPLFAVWNDGDGSDTLTGGSGFDQQIINGSDSRDIFSLSASVANAQFSRSNLIPFTLASQQFESIQVLGLGGADDFSISNLDSTSVQEVSFIGGTGNDSAVAVGSNTPLTSSWYPGDGSDQVTGGNSLLDTVVINGSPVDGDLLDLGANGVNGYFQILGGPDAYIASTNFIENFQVLGLGGSDTLTVRNLDATPITRIDFVGGTGADTLNGSLTNTPIVSTWNNGDGSDSITGGGASTDSQIVNCSNESADTINLYQNGAVGVFERINAGPFSINTSSMNYFYVNGFGGSDFFTVNNLDSTSITNVVFTGGTGNDSLFGSTTNAIIATIWNNGDGSDTINGGGSIYDTQYVNGSPTAGDIFTLAPSGTNALFQRTNLGLFSITATSLETFVVTGLGGNDSLTMPNLDNTTLDNVYFYGSAGDDSVALPAMDEVTSIIDGGPDDTIDVITVDYEFSTVQAFEGGLVVQGREKPIYYTSVEQINGINFYTGGRGAGDFDGSGCTDVVDFLFLLDYWQQVAPGVGPPAIGVSDFLGLLDSWQIGPFCS